MGVRMYTICNAMRARYSTMVRMQSGEGVFEHAFFVLQGIARAQIDQQSLQTQINNSLFGIFNSKYPSTMILSRFLIPAELMAFTFFKCLLLLRQSQSLQFKNIIEVNRVMLILVFLFFLVTFIRAQFHLESMNRCLANCALCRNDDLSTCSGREMFECVKGYNGPNCRAKQTYAAEIVLIDSTKSTLPPAIWQNTTTEQCSYTNSKMGKTVITIIGMYTKAQQNMAVVPINPNYQNYIITFNLIRGSWTPFSDSLRIVVFDQFNVELQDYFIQFPSRNEINPDVNLLRCKGNQPRMIEKFQIQGLIDHTKQDKLIIKFEGDIFSSSDWGLTDVKVLFGCSKFLAYSGQDCSKCVEGYYQISSMQSNTKMVLGCEPCPLSCSKCTDNSTCQACSVGFILTNGKCKNNNTIASYIIPGRSLSCPNGRTLLQSSFVNGQQRIEFEIKTWPAHQIARLIFWMAYVPQAMSTTSTLGIEIDGVKQVEIIGGNLKNMESKVKESCTGFGDKGYFSLYKVVTGYLSHEQPAMSVRMWGIGSGKLGVWDMLLEYEPVNQTNQTNQTEDIKNNSNSSMLTNTTNNSINGSGSNNKTGQRNTTNNGSNVDSQTNGTIKNDSMQNTNNTSNENTTFNSNTSTNTNTTGNTTTNNTHNHTNNNGSTNTNTTSANNTTSGSNQTNNTNSTNSTNTNNNSHSNNMEAELADNIRKIQAVKSQVLFALKLDKELTITITYPIQVSKFPHITVLLQPNTSIIATVEKQTPTYQELSLALQESLLNQKITLYMTNQDPILTDRRSLQSQSKPIVSNLGEIMVNRYDYLSQTQWESINRYSSYFEVLSWAIIVATMVLSFFGSSVITMNTVLLFQIIFLHVYIQSQYLPTNFKNTISGLQRMQNLDYFTKGAAQSIEYGLLGDVLQQSPARFTTYNKDINFTRMVYPCVIAFIAYVIFFILLTVVRKLIEPNLVVADIEEERSRCEKFKLFIIRVSQRYLNFYYQIWQHQYIVYIWAGCIQLHNMAYPSGANKSEIANMIFCFTVLLIMLLVPPITMVYLNKKYFRLDYFEYSYWYENIFFLLLPQESLPSNHHRVFIVIRNVRYIILVVCFAFLGDYPVQALVIIILTHLFSLLYLKITHLELKPFNSILNLIEHGLLICLAVTMLVAYGTSSVFHTNQYMIIGHVLTTCCLLLTITGLVRFLFNVYHKILDQTMEKEISEFKPAIGTERVV